MKADVFGDNSPVGCGREMLCVGEFRLVVEIERFDEKW